jgi:broad specificity phosphatase PhoE
MNTNPQKIVLVRHGETEWSKAMKHTGHTDLPLIEEGRKVAREACKVLKSYNFSAVFASPLQRAKETCKLAGFEKCMTILEDLIEWNYGMAEGKTTLEMQQFIPGWSVWKSDIEDGESIGQVAERADRVISLVKKIQGDVALFAHGRVLRILAARWVGLSPHFAASLILQPAKICVLSYERETPAILNWNV